MPPPGVPAITHCSSQPLAQLALTYCDNFSILRAYIHIIFVRFINTDMNVRAACLAERGMTRPSPLALRPRTRPLAPQPASVIPWQRAGPRVIFALGTARSSAALARELLRPSGAHVLDRRFVRAQAVPQLRVGDAGANERLRARSASVTFASLGAISARSRRNLGEISAP